MFSFGRSTTSISEVEWPAVPGYPTSSPYAAELDKAQAEFERELATDQGWIDQGDKDGVKLSKKVNEDDKSQSPIVGNQAPVELNAASGQLVNFMGWCFYLSGGEAFALDQTNNLTFGIDQFLGLIQLVGMRKRWDSRLLEGFMLARSDSQTYSFYSCMAGFGWIVSPRDIVGANHNILPTESNSDLLIVQTSVVDSEHGPEQSGRVRASLGLSGWRFRPVDGGLEVTYLVRIGLNGSLPRSIVDKIASETPLCTARARDVYHSIGFPPYIRPTTAQPEPTCTFQMETFSNPGDKFEYHCKITTAAGCEFDLVYDHAKMFDNGVEVSVEGGGVEAVDDGEGVVAVRCSTDGDRAVIILKGQ